MAVDPITMAFIGSTATPILSSIFGNIFSADDRAAAEAAQEKAIQEIERIGAGPDLAKRIMLREFEVAGVLTPQIEKAIELEAPKVAQIKEDPRFKEAQLSALKAFQERGIAGFTPEERYEIEKQRRTAERSAASQRASVLENLRARGLMDSGAGLAAQLQSADVLAERQAEEASRRSAMASQRVLQSITQGGTYAGQLRGQEFGIAKDMASAKDEFDKLNIQNQIARQQRAVERQMQADTFNLQIAQDVKNRTTAAEHAELLRQRQAEQQMFQNKMNVASLRAGAYGQQAQQLQQQAAQTQQAAGAFGSGISQGLSAYGAYQAGAPQRTLASAQADYYRSLTPQAPLPPPPPVNDRFLPPEDQQPGTPLPSYYNPYTIA